MKQYLLSVYHPEGWIPEPEVGEKIVSGKLNKWFEEHCLLDQSFVKDDSMSVGDLIHRAVGSLGENIRVRRFARYALGE